LYIRRLTAPTQLCPRALVSILRSILGLRDLGLRDLGLRDNFEYITVEIAFPSVPVVLCENAIKESIHLDVRPHAEEPQKGEGFQFHSYEPNIGLLRS